MHEPESAAESVISEFSSEVLSIESFVKVGLLQVYRSLHRFSPNAKLQTKLIHSQSYPCERILLLYLLSRFKTIQLLKILFFDLGTFSFHIISCAL